MKKNKLLSAVLATSMLCGLTSPLTVKATTNGQFENPLSTIQKKPYSSKKFTAKPLVILIEFPDYKYTDLDTKEKNFRINNFKGSETTPKFYESLFFGEDFYKTSDGKEHITVNKFFKEESGGTYEFKGKVLGWYKAKKNAEEYGQTQSQARELVKEAIEQASKDVDLSQFDVEDKWDLDGDGNYNEPDGIIDSLVVIHPGLGEEWGGGSLGENAIWPFRWGFNVFGNDMDSLKPAEKQAIVNRNPAVTDKNGKKFLLEDFTIFEQDLPVDLFDHEFGHVLGLPDLYGTDRSSTPPVENWSIMGGSYSGNPRGSQPVSYGAYCKEFLQKDFEKRGRAANWQNSKVLNLQDIDEKGLDVVLDQASVKGQNNDVVRINLPKYDGGEVKPVGKNFYFSGKGDNLENYMTTKAPIDLTGVNKAELSFKTWYNIDPGFDFASVQVKEAGTNDWIAVKGNLTTTEVDKWVTDNEKPDEIKMRNPGHGITGKNKKWTDATFDLSAFKDKKIDLRFRFRTDDNTPEDGIYIDEIKVSADSKTLLSDNAEGTPKFSFEGFVKSDGVKLYDHYYLLEWRNSGAESLVDKGLKTINIGRKGLQYDPGLVVWYINEKYAGFKPDQNTAGHKGELFAGIVDADQNPITYRYEKSKKSGADKINYQMHDAAFSLKPGSPLKIEGTTSDDKYFIEDNHTNPNPLFSDAKDYTASSYNSEAGLKLKNYGLKVFVTEESKDRSTAKLHIARYKDGANTTSQDTSLLTELKVENNKLYVGTKAKYGDKAYVEYVNKDNKTKQVALNYENGKYVGDVSFLSQDSSFKISHIILIDAVGNAKAIYNNEVHKIFGADFAKIGTLDNTNKTDDTNKTNDTNKTDDAKNTNKTNTTKKPTVQNKKDVTVQNKKPSGILGSVLPKTGEVIPMLNYILGMVIILAGIHLKRKSKRIQL